MARFMYEYKTSRVCLVCECQELPAPCILDLGTPWLCDKCRAALLKVVKREEQSNDEE